LIKHEFIKRLHKRFDEEGIVIPFRIRTIISRGDRPSAALPGNLS
jgi:small-conductance mechanosensitive channel